MDLIDRLAGLNAGSPLHALRHQREKVAVATQASYDALLHPQLPGLPLVHRLLVALYACRLTPNAALAAHYREWLDAQQADGALVEAVASGTPAQVAAIVAIVDAKLAAALNFTAVLTERPLDGDKALLQSLPAAGLATPDVVALSQLVAFLSYQTRLLAGLVAMKTLETAA